jgi:hypothetical protein
MSQALFQQFAICQTQRDRSIAERDALQQRLTVQYQREDDLKGLLREVLGSCALLFQDHDATAETTDLHGRIEAALKPSAEAVHHE